jgi:uncharacterized protein
MGNVTSNRADTPPVQISASRKEAATATDLCLSCGFCCDGTLFEYVTVEAPKLPDMLGRGNREYAPDGLPPGIRQPCACYSEGRCSAYAARPNACAKYECALLRRYSRGEIHAEDALERIRQVRDLADWIRGYLRARLPVEHRSTWSSIFRFTKGAEANDLGKLRATHPEFFLKIGILDMLSVRHFGTRIRCSPPAAPGGLPVLDSAPTGMNEAHDGTDQRADGAGQVPDSLPIA